MVGHDVGLLRLARILLLASVVLRRRDVLVDLVEVLLLVGSDASLKDLVLAGRHVGDTWVDHHLLPVFVDEGQRVLRLLAAKVVSVDLVVDRELLPLVLRVPADDRCQSTPGALLARRQGAGRTGPGLLQGGLVPLLLDGGVRPLRLLGLDTAGALVIRHQIGEAVDLLLEGGVVADEGRLRVVGPVLFLLLEVTREHALQLAVHLLRCPQLAVPLLLAGEVRGAATWGAESVPRHLHLADLLVY